MSENVIDAIMPVLRQIQNDIAELRRTMEREFADVREDLRRQRTALNEFHHSGHVTRGEADAIHHDLNKAMTDIAKLKTKMEIVEARDANV